MPRCIILILLAGSFVPMILGLLTSPESEPFLYVSLWTSAVILLLMTISFCIVDIIWTYTKLVSVTDRGIKKLPGSVKSKKRGS
jgi:hypothetical protein